eukprot:8548702-Lingulodinium_polyedra.AAC.1
MAVGGQPSLSILRALRTFASRVFGGSGQTTVVEDHFNWRGSREAQDNRHQTMTPLRALALSS